MRPGPPPLATTGKPARAQAVMPPATFDTGRPLPASRFAARSERDVACLRGVPGLPLVRLTDVEQDGTLPDEVHGLLGSDRGVGLAEHPLQRLAQAHAAAPVPACSGRPAPTALV